MSIYQLVYVSFIDREFNSHQVDKYFEQVSTLALNQRVTGFMIYSEQSILQILEGDRQSVLNVFDSISSDPLNSGYLIISEKPVDKKYFQKYLIHYKQMGHLLFNDLYGLSLISIENFLQKLVVLAEQSISQNKEFDPKKIPTFKKGLLNSTPNINDFFHYSTEVSADEIFLMNNESQIVYVNDAACEKLGYRREELIDMFVWQWDPLCPKELWPRLWGDFVRKKHLHFETQHKKKSGEIFPVEIRAHLFVSDNEQYALTFVNDISHRKKIELENEELKKSFEMLKLHKELLDIHSSLSITDGKGVITYINDQYCQLSGYTKQELLGRSHDILKSGRHGKKYYQNLYKTIHAGKIWRGEFCNKTKDDNFYWIDATIVPKFAENGSPLEFYSVCTDITDRKQAEIELRQKEEQVRTILELAGDGIHILDENGNVIECSQSFADSLGYTKEEILKLNVKDWEAFIDHDKLPSIFKKLLNSADRFETKHKRKDNTVIDVEIIAKGILLEGKSYIYASSRNISERVEAQRIIEKKASTDQLTGLANRHKFVEYFEHHLNLAKREQEKIVLILADLDKLKDINDKYGHLTGDAALKHVAELLSQNCRKYDLASRIGGDEFAVLLIHTEIPSAIRYIEEIEFKLKKTFVTGDNEIIIGLSFGIAAHPEHANTVQGLLKRADIALYNAKKTGKSGCPVFSQFD